MRWGPPLTDVRAGCSRTYWHVTVPTAWISGIPGVWLCQMETFRRHRQRAAEWLAGRSLLPGLASPLYLHSSPASTRRSRRRLEVQAMTKAGDPSRITGLSGTWTDLRRALPMCVRVGEVPPQRPLSVDGSRLSEQRLSLHGSDVGPHLRHVSTRLEDSASLWPVGAAVACSYSWHLDGQSGLPRRVG